MVALLFVSFLTFGMSDSEFDHILTIDVTKTPDELSPLLHGIFLEDINHAIDGGLHAELVRNRSFEHTDRTEGWTIQLSDGVKFNMTISDSEPMNENNRNYLKLEILSEGYPISVINGGYDGIPLKKGEKYLFSIYIRGEPEYCGAIEIRLEDSRGRTFAETELTGVFDSEWSKHSKEFTASADCDDASLFIVVKDPGTVCIDMVSLFPSDTWNGMRRDLLEMLEALEPSFVRFPGGCLVEGDSLDNAYRWKDTIGPPEERKTNRNLWGYHQSYGIGFYEYLLLSEYLNAEPIPIFNAGMSCQVRGAEYCPFEELDEWIQDVLDFIEFANGSPDTEWGSIRAEMGHENPFDVKFVGVGNENWGDEYHVNFELFREAIKESYPEITIMFSGPPSYEGAAFRYAWRWSQENEVEIYDEHIYASPEWFLINANRYDRYSRNGPKIMLGEYAAHTPGTRNNLQAALAEASFMTSLERNSDVVIMACYAPLFNRVGWSQWTPDLIWFDNSSVFGTPSYYVQKMFSQNQGKYLLESSLTNEWLSTIGYSVKRLYHVCTYDPDAKEIIIKMVNPWPDDKTVLIEIQDGTSFNGKGSVTTLTSASQFDENNLINPELVVPVHFVLEGLSDAFEYTFPGFSITIVRLPVSSGVTGIN